MNRSRDINQVPETRVLQKKSQNREIYYPNLFPNHQPNRRSWLVSVALRTTRTLVLATPPGISCEAIEVDSLSRHTMLVVTHYRLKHRTVNKAASVYFGQQGAFPAYKPQRWRLQWRARGGEDNDQTV